MSKDIQRNFVFKNVMAYRIGPNWNATVPEIEAALSAIRFTECTPDVVLSTGMLSPMLKDMIDALGGENVFAEAASNAQGPPF